jgi:hypothetical protein
VLVEEVTTTNTQRELVMEFFKLVSDVAFLVMLVPLAFMFGGELMKKLATWL